jgi:hypothetical protein
MEMKKQLGLLAVACSLLAVAHAAPYEPKTGSVERKQLADDLRLPMEQRIGKPILFRFTHLRQDGDWAYAVWIPLQPNGRPFDWRGTRWAEPFPPEDACTLLRREGGAWRAVHSVIGPTDVTCICAPAFVESMRESGGAARAAARSVPTALFPNPMCGPVAAPPSAPAR